MSSAFASTSSPSPSSSSSSSGFFRTSDGCELAYAFRRAKGGKVGEVGGVSGGGDEAIVFLHGSYHASFCYERFWLDAFADGGVPAYALDFRAHGRSGTTTTDEDEEGGVAGTLERHAEDVREFVEFVSKEGSEEEKKVILSGHSFGGLVAQKVYAEDERNLVSSLVLLASVPPTGNGEMVKRFLKDDLWKSLKITWAFIAKTFSTDVDSCRECFFSETVDEREVEEYRKLIAASSTKRLLDMRRLNQSLPIKITASSRKAGSNNVLVIGGRDDYVVDIQGLRETAAFWNTSNLKVLDGLAHDVMLDTKQAQVANEILAFVTKT